MNKGILKNHVQGHYFGSRNYTTGITPVTGELPRVTNINTTSNSVTNHHPL